MRFYSEVHRDREEDAAKRLFRKAIRHCGKHASAKCIEREFLRLQRRRD